jgi:hypothetical protein
LKRVILVIILGGFLIGLPFLLNKAPLIDQEANQTIISDFDDWSFQVLAINLAQGHGFSDHIFGPWQDYHLSKFHPSLSLSGQYSFYRAPGFPLMLAGVYKVFGDQTITAWYFLLVIAWGTAFLLPLIGYNLAGWIGTLARGLTGMFYLLSGSEVASLEGIYYHRLLSEPAATFWLVLFAFLFTTYLKRKSSFFLYLAAVALVGVIYIRAYYLIVLPLFLAYLYFSRMDRKKLAFFALITFLPLVAWSVYASCTAHQFIIFSTQGEQDFSRFNNMDVLTGFGPNHYGKGEWQPGFAFNEKGEIIITNSNLPRPGENGYIKGLQFWVGNLKLVPALFYAKMKAGLWYPEGGFFLGVIGYLLTMIGFRKAGCRRIFSGFSPREILLIQVGLVMILTIAGNHLHFAVVLAIWSILLWISLLAPVGDAFPLQLQMPFWFLTFLVGFVGLVLLYGGNPRFHYALDPILILAGLIGSLTLLYELLKFKLELAALYLGLYGLALVNSLRM